MGRTRGTRGQDLSYMWAELEVEKTGIEVHLGRTLGTRGKDLRYILEGLEVHMGRT